MSSQLRARGKVIELMGRGACRVELPNGHRCIARPPEGREVTLNEEVTVEFHPYDLSRGRVV